MFLVSIHFGPTRRVNPNSDVACVDKVVGTKLPIRWTSLPISASVGGRLLANLTIQANKVSRRGASCQMPSKGNIRCTSLKYLEFQVNSWYC